MIHAAESLWDYALGTLEEPERSEVAKHVAECAACAVELRAAKETVALIGVDLPPVTPSADVLERLLQSTQGPFEGLVAKLMKFWDVGAERARQLLDEVLTAPWVPSGIPGVNLQHIEAGPAMAGLDTGFVRFDPGTQFPRHSHAGDELQLILEGTLHEAGGATFRVGDTMFRPKGSEHAFVIGPEGCTLALILDGGIVIEGVRYGVKS
jgi:putative transcriptional regulator